MRSVSRIILPILLTGLGFTQAPAGPQFEVASIRPSASSAPGQVSVGVHMDGSQVHVTSLTLRDYLAIAYRIPATRISGPDWTGSDRFDVSATLPAGSSTSQLPEMLQALLTDRFRLKMHRDKKQFPVYVLVIGKGPLKLKEAPPDPETEKDDPKGTVNVAAGGSAAGVSLNLGHGSSWSFVPNHFEAKKLSMEQVAANLERFSDRPVVDMTGLKGKYDFTFEVNPDDYQVILMRSAINAGVVLSPHAMRVLDNSSSASLGEALQQTGLRLDARNAPLDVLVIDDALKTPIAN
jgi:uncharacterized protein (TIGR03435 family)